MRAAASCSSVSALPAVCQEPVLPLTLKRAVEIALAPAGNTRVQLAAESIRIAEARSAEARSAFLPNVDGQVSYSDQTRNLEAFGFGFGALSPLLPFQIPTFVGPFGVFDARLNATQSVFDFSSIRRSRQHAPPSRPRKRRSRERKIRWRTRSRACISPV